MQPRLVFLHTAPMHVATFSALLAEVAPQCEAEHVVDESLLADAQRVGADDPALVARVQAAMTDAAERGAAAVVCTCSTIGGIAERTPTGGRFVALRIDRAMADRAASGGPRVLVVAAVQSTLEPTSALLRESAAALDRAIEIRTVLAEGAWARFVAGDRAGYLDTVVRCVREAVGDADVIVLAQASMAPAAEALQDLGVDVLSSPRLGVQSIAARLAA
ncbi:Asp/Glu/hydantoin racemase [Aquincola sp. S2]|uniref:Asp/Glu/hydantoin racemase n=1 Tax=Pseudaquabacterium terrae TaxID=2732868 RepID=A0ABX2ET25_9BURK|nr:aspartate/glutamate racemase family protein [Aquabacterium terrae]NRF71788.1 Asp/Glu/hydantoin racemase [Aquabacterium terrae]